jgi:hypothetical protein
MASGKTHSAMPSKLCPAKNKWFGWKPETWDKASFNAWMGAYHEASPAVFSEDLGSSPRYIDVGPQWGVEHGGCLEESAWYSVMAAGGLVAEQVIGVGPSARATTPQPTSTKDRNIPFLFFFIFSPSGGNRSNFTFLRVVDGAVLPLWIRRASQL